MSDAITLDVLSSSPVQLDVGDADPIAREEIAELDERVTTVEGDVSALDGRMDTAEGAISALDGRMDAAEGDISTLGTTVDGIDERVEAIEADYVTSEDVMGALGGEAPALVSGSSRAVLGDAETASWMGRTTAADGAALIEAIYGNTVVQDGSLLPVRIEGVETVGFNQWDEEWEVGSINNQDGTNVNAGTNRIRSKGFIPVFPDTEYCVYNGSGITTYPYFYDADKGYIGLVALVFSNNKATFTTPANCRYLRFRTNDNYGTTYKGDICINLSDPARNGTYEPHWSSQRTIPAATYFPDGLRSAGSVRDELRADAAVMRVGAVDLGTLTYQYDANLQRFFTTSLKPESTTGRLHTNIACALFTASSSTQDMTCFMNTDGTIFIYDHAYTDAAAFKTAMSGVMLYYELATPTTTPIDPPLPLSYRVGAGGTERVMVASGTQSAPPIFVTRYPLDPADLAASIAPRESATAEANHAVGDLIMLGFALCKVTTAIARGEAITIGTNVTKTSVAAEIAALS